MTKPIVIAVSGWKNAGKTTLIEKLLPQMRQKGLRVAVIKHDGHTFAAEPENVDTGRFLAAGAYGTAVYDSEKCKIVLHKHVDEHQLALEFPEADLILFEGGRYSQWPKLEVLREGKPVCIPETVLALISDLPVKHPGIPTVSPSDIMKISDIILAYVNEVQGCD